MGQIIQRYRQATLTWCLQAVTAATPKTDLTQTRARWRTPVEDLCGSPRIVEGFSMRLPGWGPQRSRS